MTEKDKIIVLGSKGMLGQMVVSYFFKRRFKVVQFNDRFDESSISTYVDKLNEIEDSYVFNCIGRIKQKSDDPYSLFLSNSILPLELSRRLKNGHFLIHPSTDCVFNGIDGAPFERDSFHNATDLYGISKSLGEQALLARLNCLIIRVSIIGVDLYTIKGLLSWFLSQAEGSVVNGYNNHFWNGITTLEWCKRVEDILRNYDRDNISKIVQIGTNDTYSKYEMLNLFKQVFNKKVSIIDFTDTNIINRTLKPSILSPSLEIQLNELKIFCEKLVS